METHLQVLDVQIAPLGDEGLERLLQGLRIHANPPYVLSGLEGPHRLLHGLIPLDLLIKVLERRRNVSSCFCNMERNMSIHITEIRPVRKGLSTECAIMHEVRRREMHSSALLLPAFLTVFSLSQIERDSFMSFFQRS
jgi:hypothetical protein